MCALALTLLLVPQSVVGQSSAVRLRVQWGGPVSRLWQGEIIAPGAALSDIAPLGIEADEAGSMWIDGDRLQVAPRSARAA